MHKFQSLTSKVIPLPKNDVDTDQIIPAQYLTSTSRDGYGQNLFRRLRDTEPDFPLNQPQFKDAEILLTGYNFGCGSSREHAVWAIAGANIKVVIAESFADIFANNSAKNGLLLVCLPKNVIERLLKKAENGDLSVTVDLEKQVVMVKEGLSNENHSFEYDPFRKHCLLNGLDDINYILSHGDDITKFREKNKKSWIVSPSLNNEETLALAGTKN
jgi:3-isopropylmalate/(R)-2-methylmalate dehydratase small subunit